MKQITLDDVKEQKQMFLKLLDEHPTCFDKNILPLLCSLNKINSLATRYSCESHLDNKESVFYIQFVATEEGELFLQKLHLKIIDKLDNYNKNSENNKNGKYYFLPAIQYNKRPVLDKSNNCFICSSISYAPTDFGWDETFATEEMKIDFIKMFEEAILHCAKGV